MKETIEWNSIGVPENDKEIEQRSVYVLVKSSINGQILIGIGYYCFDSNYWIVDFEGLNENNYKSVDYWTYINK